jgi:integrase
MPRYQGVYQERRSGRWYFKATVGRDPLTGKWNQVTRRGFTTATQASRARVAFLDQVVDLPGLARQTSLTVDELLDLYLDDLDAQDRLSPKTRYDYRRSADAYVRPWLGRMRVRDVSPETVSAWQKRLSEGGGAKDGRPLSPNTVRLARAPLAGACKYAVAAGIVVLNPVSSVPRPVRRRGVPRHWSPEQAREFLACQKGDRLWPLWAFLLGSGLRIGELVWLRWRNVDLERRLVRVVEFAAALGYELVESSGKSRDAVRTVDLDDHLVGVLEIQRKLQAEDAATVDDYEETDYVFTKPTGGYYHPQWISRTLATETELAGLPRLTAHGLRHTSATLMLASGVPPKVAAERLGHADATLFSNLYSHVTPTMQRQAAEQIGEALFGD